MYSLPFSLAAVIIATKLLGELARRFGQPSVLGELFAGVMLGGGALALVDPRDPAMHALGELGLFVLLFQLGLHTDMRSLRRVAKALGLAGLAVCDPNSLAGVVRAHAKAKELGLRFVLGCRLVFADGSPDVLCYPTSREAYGRLTRLLTVGQMRAAKGGCELHWEDLVQHGDGQLLIVVPPAATFV